MFGSGRRIKRKSRKSSPKRRSRKMSGGKRRSPKRKSRSKSPKRRSSKRRSPKRKSPKRKSSRRMRGGMGQKKQGQSYIGRWGQTFGLQKKQQSRKDDCSKITSGSSCRAKSKCDWEYSSDLGKKACMYTGY